MGKISRAKRKINKTELEEFNKRLVTQRDEDIVKITDLQYLLDTSDYKLEFSNKENIKLKERIDDLETDKEYLLSLLEKK